MAVKPHLEVSRQIFSNLVYADDTAFLLSSEDNSRPCLHSFHRQLPKDFMDQDKIRLYQTLVMSTARDAAERWTFLS